MLTIYGTMLCGDCVAAEKSFRENGVEFEFRDITKELPYMKEFLKIRDASPLFDEARAAGGIGIPAIIMEDGSIEFDSEKIVKELKK